MTFTFKLERLDGTRPTPLRSRPPFLCGIPVTGFRSGRAGRYK
jgi:hypothetical protein